MSVGVNSFVCSGFFIFLLTACKKEKALPDGRAFLTYLKLSVPYDQRNSHSNYGKAAHKK